MPRVGAKSTVGGGVRACAAALTVDKIFWFLFHLWKRNGKCQQRSLHTFHLWNKYEKKGWYGLRTHRHGKCQPESVKKTCLYPVLGLCLSCAYPQAVFSDAIHQPAHLHIQKICIFAIPNKYKLCPLQFIMFQRFSAPSML